MRVGVVGRALAKMPMCDALSPFRDYPGFIQWDAVAVADLILHCPCALHAVSAGQLISDPHQLTNHS